MYIIIITIIFIIFIIIVTQLYNLNNLFFVEIFCKKKERKKWLYWVKKNINRIFPCTVFLFKIIKIHTCIHF